MSFLTSIRFLLRIEPINTSRFEIKVRKRETTRVCQIRWMHIRELSNNANLFPHSR